jgi:hypothetical protein
MVANFLAESCGVDRAETDRSTREWDREARESEGANKGREKAEPIRSIITIQTHENAFTTLITGETGKRAERTTTVSERKASMSNNCFTARHFSESELQFRRPPTLTNHVCLHPAPSHVALELLNAFISKSCDVYDPSFDI